MWILWGSGAKQKKPKHISSILPRSIIMGIVMMRKRRNGSPWNSRTHNEVVTPSGTSPSRAYFDRVLGNPTHTSPLTTHKLLSLLLPVTWLPLVHFPCDPWRPFSQRCRPHLSNSAISKMHMACRCWRLYPCLTAKRRRWLDKKRCFHN